MFKYILILCAASAFCTCVGTDYNRESPPSADRVSESKENNYWITLPKSNELVFIGVSGLQLKPETEIAAAREDAARKASMYHGLAASFISVQSIGTGLFDHYVDSDIRLNYDQQIEKYLDKLVFDPERDVVRTDKAVFVRFTYQTAFPGSITYTFVKNPNGSPEWTSRRPDELGGFMTGVGFARKQARQRETIAKSCEAAAAALVSRMSTSIDTKEISAKGENATVIQEQSSGRLSNFLVLEIWEDPESDAIWTLAIARPSR
ncbi:MAG: hypothetical protein FWD36_10185 [Treponema sp.]|nr:hypothetical protein [Treponema sp.]